MVVRVYGKTKLKKGGKKIVSKCSHSYLTYSDISYKTYEWHRLRINNCWPLLGEGQHREETTASKPKATDAPPREPIC